MYIVNVKNIVCLLSVLFFCLWGVGCSNSESLSSSQENSMQDVLAQKGFVLVQASGNPVTLGTDDESASVKDRPSMVANFDYDFWIGKHEVTCGEMGLDCDDSLPATDVTYFDAVLYANKLSKAEGFDTAYTYSKATFDENGACTGLEDLLFWSSKEAFRLPTEAEWSYVANQGWNPDDSWNSNNSNFKLHKVCSSYVDELGLCDMAGNAKEWVEDALVPFVSMEILDYIGVQGNSLLDERVVKGGSYRDGPSDMKIFKRGDIYTVTSSSKADYIGFRLAFGAILNPGKLDNEGHMNSAAVSILAQSKDVNHFNAGLRSKLVFRNDVTHSLTYLYYPAVGAPITANLNFGISAYHPDISPDGNWLAFCTGLEGVSGQSKVYAYPLDGGNLVELNVEQAAIPRWRVLPGGDTVLVYVTNAGNNKIDSTFFASSTWQVKFANGKFGTPEKLFDGAYHGGVSENDELAVTGARLLRSRVKGDDGIWYNGEQACNVSLSRGGANRTLFLDFASKTGKAFVGSTYGVHERAFVADSDGEMVLSVAAPEGYAFDHTEWVLGSDSVFVATLTNANGAHKKVVLVNAYTGEILDLAEGDELWHPVMWRDIAGRDSLDPLLDLDSAGVYYTAGAPFFVLELRVQMENFWKMRDSVTAVALGSSRTMYGVHAPWVKSQKLLNMAFSSGDIYGIDYLARNYALQHLPKLKYLVLETSIDFLWVNETASWQIVFGSVPGYRYDESHDFWKDGVPKGLEKLVSDVPKPQSEMTSPAKLGEFLLPTNGWGSPNVMHDTTFMRATDPIVVTNLEKYRNLVELAKSQGVTVVFLIPPQNPEYAKTGSFGIYGALRSDVQKIIDELSSMGAVVFDENNMGKHAYTDDMAFNEDHLSKKGAERLSARLDSLFVDLEK